MVMRRAIWGTPGGPALWCIGTESRCSCDARMLVRSQRYGAPRSRTQFPRYEPRKGLGQRLKGR
jgi:hypothetical protein